jgi:hypothetical protein
MQAFSKKNTVAHLHYLRKRRIPSEKIPLSKMQEHPPTLGEHPESEH